MDQQPSFSDVQLPLKQTLCSSNAIFYGKKSFSKRPTNRFSHSKSQVPKTFDPHIQTSRSWIWLVERWKRGILIGQFWMQGRDNKNLKLTRRSWGAEFVDSRSSSSLLYAVFYFDFKYLKASTCNGYCYRSRENNPTILRLGWRRNRSMFTWSLIP